MKIVQFKLLRLRDRKKKKKKSELSLRTCARPSRKPTYALWESQKEKGENKQRDYLKNSKKLAKFDKIPKYTSMNWMHAYILKKLNEFQVG